ncbi:MAG TPA: ABC transporter permease, partial [Gemmatimonadaceae bacterium]|nr:ABC transporter permease [Gemmatimonadaceae bacterium]
DPGFQPAGLTTFQVSASRARYPNREQVDAYYASVERELRAIPGVADVTYADEMPLTRNGSIDIFVPKERGDRGRDNPQVRVGSVAPGYWKTLGVRLVAGRTFSPNDAAGSPRVIVVNDELARRVYGNEDPVGRMVSYRNYDWQIIGVVASMRMQSLAEPPEPELYTSLTQDLRRYHYVFVKSAIAPEQLVSQMRQSLRRVDPTVAMTEVASMEQRVRDALAPQRFRASLIAGLGILALVLSTLGIYGVVAYAVSRQTREIGVRMALGEDQSSVRRRVLFSALRMAVVGVALGAVLAMFASTWLSAFVVGVRARDPLTLGAAALLIAAVTAVAAYIPARRASRIDPLVALRAD